MAAPNKKIIILGHGEISDEKLSYESQEMRPKVYFYCPSEQYLDRHFIPTFIEHILHLRNNKCVEKMIKGSSITDRNLYEFNGKFPWDDYNREHYLFSNGEYMFQMMCSNKVPECATNYNSPDSTYKELDKLFASKKDDIEIYTCPFLQYTLNECTIVIVPKASCGQKIPLSEIITWAKGVSDKQDLEFYWLACRKKECK